jgi:threonine dehydrogenase-like Zn-dependent dehydrogenase
MAKSARLESTPKTPYVLSSPALRADIGGQLVLGHEFSGIVIKTGKQCTLKPGDRVAVEPGASCGQCNLCQDGKYQLCTEQLFAGTPANYSHPKHDGSLQTFYRSPEHWCFKLPDSVTLEEGAIVGFLSREHLQG